jgi:hypothetical protein
MNKILKAIILAAVLAATSISSVQAQAAQPGGTQAAAATSSIGTVQTISGANITLKTDAGVIVSVTLQPNAPVMRIEPGQTSLKDAVPIYITDIQVGDRVLAQGSPGSGDHTILALRLVAIKKAAIESKQQQDLQDWTRRGTGGLVVSVDPAAATIALKVSGAAGAAKTVTVHTAKNTQILRYAADSVKFDDAKPSTLDTIKSGDQLLARGTRSADGNDVTADAVISGAFRNLSGTIASVTLAQNELTLKDVATKTVYTVKLMPDSTMRKLPVQAANMLAARMKASAGGTTDAAAGGDASAGGRGGRGGRGGADLSQVVARAPTVTLADLQKGDAVMIVSTAGTAPGQVSAIQLVAGVEPILEASPNAGMSLPAWDVGGGGGDAAE